MFEYLLSWTTVVSESDSCAFGIREKRRERERGGGGQKLLENEMRGPEIPSENRVGNR
jgi:hypothetical protein